MTKKRPARPPRALALRADPEFAALQRTQLDAQLGPQALLRSTERPTGGWIRAIRTALGMTLEQLGARMQLSKQGAQELEKREADDTITIASLRRTAEALECHVIVALVPKTSLDDMITERARAIATDERGRIVHTMRLEDQKAGVNEDSSVNARAYELSTTGLRRLWD